MTKEQIKEKVELEKQLDKLIKKEEKISERLNVLSFLEKIEHVENMFKEYDGYAIVIEKGNKFNIKIRNKELSRCIVVFVLPNEYSVMLMDLLKLAAQNEISK